jgi:prepilin-type N-terminal cleavage/methylation domain-containing protein/prepilin-type processing-associated H-X9-DG protein
MPAKPPAMNHKHPSISIRRRPGFSLVELLVTITIIIILAALTLVVTDRMKTGAWQANAINAMRQIGMANVAYSTENNGSINVIRDPGEWGSGFEGAGHIYARNSFVGRMQPYLFANLTFHNEKTLKTQTEAAYADLLNTSNLSTMAGTPFSGVPVYKDGSGIGNPVAVNLALRPAWRQAPLRVASFQDPASIPYLTFGRYYFDLPQASEYTPLPLPGDRRRAIYYLPNRKATICFLDGHVEMIAPPMPSRYFEKPPTPATP